MFDARRGLRRVQTGQNCPTAATTTASDFLVFESLALSAAPLHCVLKASAR